MKRAYRYRYPTAEQADLLNRTFGCVRYVYNRALAERSRAWTQEQRRVTFADTCRMLTGWKAEPETAWLQAVSNVAQQQGLQHLQQGFVNFWGKRAKYPQFTSKRKSRASATFTTSGFRYRDGRITLAKTNAPLDIRWSRPLPDGAEPSGVTASQDAPGRSWSELRRQLGYKADWYGRTVIAVDRFYPSSKTCSACGVIAAKMPLNVRDWVFASCGTAHDRDVNAAKNILAAGLAVAACGDGVRPARA